MMTRSTTKTETFWDAYCAAKGHVGEPKGVDQFGDTSELADELLALVLAGTKRATCSLRRDFPPGGEPKPGDHWIITDGRGEPHAIIRTVSTEFRPIRDVDAEFAWTEGEGDRSRVWWKRQHDAYFTRQAAREGFVYSDAMEGVCEIFELVWPDGRMRQSPPS